MMTSPVYPDDVLVLETEYIEKRESRSKPDRGVVTLRFSLSNQDGVEVFRGRGRTMVARAPRTGTGTGPQA
jgi:acyl dehydratase